VPLDGTRLAEAALPHALDLAARLGASVTLAMVTRPAVYLFPTTLPMVNVQEIDRRLAETARDYLARVSERLSARAGKRRRVATVALRGLPADELLALIERRRFDLVVMTSHTRAGLARAVLGSVADRLLRGSAPVLLVRPETPARRRASRGRRR
jgi:nucleotide-binding universal stress UspA family protein